MSKADGDVYARLRILIVCQAVVRTRYKKIMSDAIPDPIQRAAEIICPDEPDALALRIKSDVFSSIGRIKPAYTRDVDFEIEVVAGQFFAGLPAPLQGIAIARTEGVLAFYNRVGWNSAFLDAPLSECVPDDGVTTLKERYHAKTLHDLAYVHPKHFEKMMGKVETAQLWERLKRFANSDPVEPNDNDGAPSPE